MTAMIRTTI